MTHQGASGTQGCTGAPRPVRAALWVSMVSLRRDRVDPQEARPGGDWGGRLGVDMAVGSSSLCHGDDTDRGAMRPGSSGTVYGWGGVILATRVKGRSSSTSTTATELNFCCLLQKTNQPQRVSFRSQLNLSRSHLKAALKAPSLQPTAYRLAR
ncbi:hypothetical protein PGT21_024314 [Puccinia graminis f. sp. tritici]|uniref:Uncharacterized protein n=1 Tax=Puccinia graminis f. sp. tritici TaxID=56615 RepID=A0A5B0QKY4_PUCGR|nr:hypothetical protein PGT21_024314 [Puccinia graminis f. sp. tritici]KAA1113763.1 hypothetical protein PGTUg99_016513 [Puccinia graminis f. sp. tritici]